MPIGFQENITSNILIKPYFHPFNFFFFFSSTCLFFLNLLQSFSARDKQLIAVINFDFICVRRNLAQISCNYLLHSLKKKKKNWHLFYYFFKEFVSALDKIVLLGNLVHKLFHRNFICFYLKFSNFNLFLHNYGKSI